MPAILRQWRRVYYQTSDDTLHLTTTSEILHPSNQFRASGSIILSQAQHWRGYKPYASSWEILHLATSVELVGASFEAKHNSDQATNRMHRFWKKYRSSNFEAISRSVHDGGQGTTCKSIARNVEAARGIIWRQAQYWWTYEPYIPFSTTLLKDHKLEADSRSVTMMTRLQVLCTVFEEATKSRQFVRQSGDPSAVETSALLATRDPAMSRWERVLHLDGPCLRRGAGHLLHLNEQICVCWMKKTFVSLEWSRPFLSNEKNFLLQLNEKEGFCNWMKNVLFLF